ncbi:hypothetical protein MGYG_06372 [Nannizzia gypsea CBS 118893]|uniref:Anaphase-promoting complex subunit 15 n=1 Tax=Arthroderma gypseum (strain ATCC MYA-4604 / CBS 118893) TaxID=535722 RepID=E4UZ43_ARTGP|nr:hypothetical protein MGYG_06372 [Nannizzia gypsea CBS 118893]EFR03373.1 hypothetical protein MGYG_06372 [Nannizzia gypsea CBS 118893]
MFGALPPIEPRDSHTLWYSSSYTGRSVTSSSQNTVAGGQPPQPGRRNGRSQGANTPLFSASFDPLSTLLAEERALKLRKQNIASFGFSWIRPAGFPKTMMGLREEEMECEEGTGAGLGEGDIEEEEEFMEGIEGGEGGMGLDGAGEGEEGDTGMERDLDGDIPDGDGEGFGLIEEGEEGYDDEEEEFLDEEEEGMMERDLDDDVPEAPDGDEEDEEEEDDDDGDDDEDEEEEEGYGDTSEVRSPPGTTPNSRTPRESSMMMERDLDGSVPDAPRETPSQQQEWEHTDSDEDIYDDDDEEENEENEQEEEDEGHSRLSWASLPPGYIPQLTPSGPRRETEAERLFLERWGGNDDSIDLGSSSILPANPLSISRRRSRRHADEDSELEDM